MVEIKAKQLLKQLKEAGFYETRVIGDHHRLTDNKGHYVTVPYTRLGDSLKNGTVSSILRQAGLK